MGGQGGSTQGAGTANGVGLPQNQSVGMGLRAQEIGIEMANALSQIKLNESQANKNEAEANKIKGVDTEAQQAYRDWETDRKSTRLNSSHRSLSRMPSSA